MFDPVQRVSDTSVLRNRLRQGSSVGIDEDPACGLVLAPRRRKARESIHGECGQIYDTVTLLDHLAVKRNKVVDTHRLGHARRIDTLPSAGQALECNTSRFRPD